MGRGFESCKVQHKIPSTKKVMQNVIQRAGWNNGVRKGVTKKLAKQTRNNTSKISSFQFKFEALV